MPEFFGLLSRGGPIILILAGLSFGSLTVVAVKLLQLRGVLSGRADRQRALELWQGGDRHAAAQAVAKGRAPADRLLHAAMTALARGQPRNALDSSLEWRGNAEVAAMQQHIRLLELTAMISPLLGLLGTVLGMIRAFQELAMAEGAANASLLAGGIWQALLTTAAGLIVAIPAAIAASLLSGRVERAAQEMESAVGQLYAIEEDRR